LVLSRLIVVERKSYLQDLVAVGEAYERLLRFQEELVLRNYKLLLLLDLLLDLFHKHIDTSLLQVTDHFDVSHEVIDVFGFENIH